MSGPSRPTEGTGPPELWTEPLTEKQIARIRRLLRELIERWWRNRRSEGGD